jgi:hypothetical protein
MHVQGAVRGRAGVFVHIPCAASMAQEHPLQTVQQGQGKEVFNALYSILYLKAVGTSEDRGAAVQQALCAFRAAFASESALITYFDNTWTAKWSAILLQSQLGQLRPGTCLILHQIHLCFTPPPIAAKTGLR